MGQYFYAVNETKKEYVGLASSRTCFAKAAKEAAAIAIRPQRSTQAVGQEIRCTLSVTTTKVSSFKKPRKSLPTSPNPWRRSTTTSLQ